MHRICLGRKYIDTCTHWKLSNSISSSNIVPTQVLNHHYAFNSLSSYYVAARERRRSFQWVTLTMYVSLSSFEIIWIGQYGWYNILSSSYSAHAHRRPASTIIMDGAISTGDKENKTATNKARKTKFWYHTSDHIISSFILLSFIGSHVRWLLLLVGSDRIRVHHFMRFIVICKLKSVRNGSNPRWRIYWPSCWVLLHSWARRVLRVICL